MIEIELDNDSVILRLTKSAVRPDFKRTSKNGWEA